MFTINYKSFIEDNFQIINKEGKIVPFIFNETQNFYYNILSAQYKSASWAGIRENILKFRQPGFSSLIEAIFTTDFIFSEAKKIDITFSDIYSHKDDETSKLFNRVSFFLDSYLARAKIPRKLYLLTDKAGKMIEGHNRSTIEAFTANARVSGRGGTKQNIHFSEPAFYPNTDIFNANELVMGAEQQVKDGVGKIFRESTGNMVGDFFNEEYEYGKKEGAKFKSRFLGWWLHSEYSLTAPYDWKVPENYEKLMKDHGASRESCYWHYRKIQGAKPSDRLRLAREYPCDDIEAFMQQGHGYFDIEALRYYKDMLKKEPYTHLTI